MTIRRKALIIVVLLLLHILNVNAQHENVITNQSILDMIEIGLSDEVIIAKITTSKCDFLTSINDLKSLKEKGVNDGIIALMIKSQDYIQISSDTIPGIYLNENGKWKRISPAQFSSSSIGPALVSSIKSTLDSASSNNISNSNLPEFFFIFDANKGTTPISNWWFSIATSPNQFILAKFKSKNNRRELDAGKINSRTGKVTGINEKHTIKFIIEKINNFKYRVTPKSVLYPEEEYCFFYQGDIPAGGYSNQSAFDFSISKGCKRINKYEVGSTVYALNQKGKAKKYTIGAINIVNDEIFYSLLNWADESYFSEIKESGCYPSKDSLSKMK